MRLGNDLLYIPMAELHIQDLLELVPYWDAEQPLLFSRPRKGKP